MPALTEEAIEEVFDQAKIQSILDFYEEVLKPRFEPSRVGDFIVLDPASFDYEVDSTPGIARKRLRVRHPNTMPVTLEIGCPVIMGAFPMVEVSRTKA
jgi:hypothetical protein